MLDVVRSTVALRQPDPQDRLRVLASAARVIAPYDPSTAHRLAREGAQLESELLSSGLAPVVSAFSSGQVDCTTAAHFIESIPATALPEAEDSLVFAITNCKPAQDPARAKVQAALDSGIVASRPLLALMEISSTCSRWSQTEFMKMFSSLPADQVQQAPNFATMFMRMAPVLEINVTRDAGLKLLEWLSRQKDSAERDLAVTMSTSTLREVLGDQGYYQALSTNVVAESIAQTAGRAGEIPRPEEDNVSVSVLEAMGHTGADQTNALVAMSAPRRAREAAAHGFASGNAGDRQSADHYFDIAFSAVDEVWSDRIKVKNAPGVVEEVSEAAAQVDAAAVLVRAQKLSDPSAQAISMLAVARVVVGQQN